MAEEGVVAHWHQSIAGLSIVPSEFYQAVANAVDARKIPGVTMSGTYFPEGPMLSGQREYLRVKRSDHEFYICGAPFANGSFVSWWLVRDEGCLTGCLTAIPFLGILLRLFVFRETYWKVDTRLMFQDAIHGAVLEVLDGLTTTQGVKALSNAERVPTISTLLGR